MTDQCRYGGRDTRLQIFVLRAETENGSAETIALDWVSPCACMMRQIVAHFETIPAASEDITLWKESVTEPKVNTYLAAMDPSAAEYNTTDWVCTVPFCFLKGDHVRIDYLNTDDQDVGVEIILEQVIGGI